MYRSIGVCQIDDGRVMDLQLTDELIRALILNPYTTVNDFKALYASMCNNSNYGKDHFLTDVVVKSMQDLIYRIEKGWIKQ